MNEKEKIGSSQLVLCAESDTFRPLVDIAKEIQRRRTFAIISHPDAGKTTLTEKLLLYGGAVQLAGSVTARKHQRATTQGSAIRRLYLFHHWRQGLHQRGN